MGQLTKRYADGSMLPYRTSAFALSCSETDNVVVKAGFNSLTSLDDLERVKAFFKDKGMYHQKVGG